MTAGRVYLVGAGPGDPELLTVKADRLLAEADVILHDGLVGEELLAALPAAALEDVGKRNTDRRTTQEAINDRLVELASAGKDVVRLKGGDPFVFGRGGEEARHLAAHGVPVEIVPGVTSAHAVPGVVGIPATDRDHASQVAIVTGHEDPTKDESRVDWETLASFDGTIVVLMGVGKLPEYTAALREAGMDPATPVAMIERGTLPDQQMVRGTLATIVDRASAIEPPAITVIGSVVDVAELLEDVLS